MNQAVEDKKAPHTIGSLSARTVGYRDEVWRLAAAKCLIKDRKLSLQTLIAMCMQHKGGLVDAETARLATNKLCGIAQSGISLIQSVESLDEVPEENILQTVGALAPAAIQSMELRDVQALLRRMDVNLADHWRVNQAFFDTLTKSQIWAVSDEIGLRGAMGPKAFDAAMKLKSEEFIKTILSVRGFTYKGAIPKFMKYAETV